MKGAAWYQGESDVGIPGYVERQRELFAGWRRQFGADMRVLVVQLANYGTPTSEPVESGWAELRQDQLDAVVADDNAALVTAIDIGEWSDIHPTNKILLGERLALAAQGVELPMPVRAEWEGDGDLVIVSFAGVEGNLSAWSSYWPISLELCGEAQNSCRFAAGRVEGDRISIIGDGKPATRVRYAWSDAPVVNTFDARKLPLPAFELPIED
jgi:sialate O-acetylesterase